jgi:CrcB protein
MHPAIAIGLGGAIGSIVRYWMQKQFNAEFPSGTLTVNLSGCFLIGLLWAIASKNGWSDVWRLALLTGFCGGFTTFSAFTLESLQLLQQNRYLFFTVYTIASVVFGLLATFAGYKIFSNI